LLRHEEASYRVQRGKEWAVTVNNEFVRGKVRRRSVKLGTRPVIRPGCKNCRGFEVKKQEGLGRAREQALYGEEAAMLVNLS
jgi:hypothetical protein